LSNGYSLIRSVSVQRLHSSEAESFLRLHHIIESTGLGTFRHRQYFHCQRSAVEEHAYCCCGWNQSRRSTKV